MIENNYTKRNRMSETKKGKLLKIIKKKIQKQKTNDNFIVDNGDCISAFGCDDVRTKNRSVLSTN